MQKFIKQLITEIEKKNSWGKNELKNLIYELALEYLPKD